VALDLFRKDGGKSSFGSRPVGQKYTDGCDHFGMELYTERQLEAVVAEPEGVLADLLRGQLA
jgi:hypothetical protein